MSLGGSKYSSSKIGESRGGLLQDSVVKRSSKVISKSSASVKVVSKANFKIYDTPLANTPKDEKETPLTFVSEQAIDILDAGTRNPHRNWLLPPEFYPENESEDLVRRHIDERTNHDLLTPITSPIKIEALAEESGL
eukprot:1173053-Amorphochlora_amoeboformis.AAC.1